MTYCHTLCAMSIGPPILRYSYFKIWPWPHDLENPWSRSCVWSKVKVMFDLQIWKVKIMVKVKTIGHVCGLRSRSRLTFKFQRSRLWSRSNPLVTFEAWSSIDMFDLQISKVKIMVKVKPIGHVCGQRSRSRLTFKFQRSRLWSRSNPLVTFEAWSSIDMFAFRFVAIGPLLAEIWQTPYLTLKIQGQGHGQGQTRWSHLSPRVQSICSLFVSWQSDNFWLRYSKFHIWPWKI